MSPAAAVLDARRGGLSIVGTAGVTEDFDFVWPAGVTVSTVTIRTGGSLEDNPTSTTGTAEVSASSIVGTTAVVPLAVPTMGQGATPIRLYLNGVLEAFGYLEPSANGTGQAGNVVTFRTQNSTVTIYPKAVGGRVDAVEGGTYVEVNASDPTGPVVDLTDAAAALLTGAAQAATLGTASAQDVAAFATAAQGATADDTATAVTAILGTLAGLGTAAVEDVDAFISSDALGRDTANPLTLHYEDAFAGQRIVFGGGVEGVMPYVQVVPTTREGTDGAGSIAGYQLYMTTGGALSADREFLAIEARGENASASYAPYFQINTWASGTGSYRPLRIGTGGVAHLLFGPNTTDIRVLEGSRFLWDADTTTYGACPATPILATRSNQVAVQLRTVTTTAATAAAIQLGRGRGTTTSITAPNVADALGKVHFGDVTSGTYTERAGIQGVAASHANDWNQGTGVGRGAGVEIYGTVPGATAFGRTAIFLASTTNDETSLTLACRISGSTSLKLVTLGAADSGGAGYRMLRVAN